MNHNSQPSIIIRRGPEAFIKMLLAVEFAALALFLLAKPLAFYKELYNQYVYQRLIPYEYDFAFTILVGVFEVMVTLYLFGRWYKETYRIDAESIRHRHGVFVRRETVLHLADIQSVSFSQGPLGKLRGYGTITLHLKDSDKTVKLKDIANPKRSMEAIMKKKGVGTAGISHNTPVYAGIERILAGHEHEITEFKSSLRWDIRLKRVNRELEKAIMKTVAAFLNSEGGYLVLGVDDGGSVVGLAHDYKTLPRKNADGFENHFTQVFNSMIGPEFRQLVRLHFHSYKEGELCVVWVTSSQKPAYVVSDGREEFYVRTGNTTTSLQFREANAYISSR